MSVEGFVKNIQNFVDYVEKVKWQNAKTYEKTHPHEYTVREWDKDLKDDFLMATKFIRDYGIEQNFFQNKYIYFYIKGYKYWTMGAPIEETTVINRERQK